MAGRGSKPELSRIHNGSNTAQNRCPSRPPALSLKIVNKMVLTVADLDPRTTQPNPGADHANQPGNYRKTVRHSRPSNLGPSRQYVPASPTNSPRHQCEAAKHDNNRIAPDNCVI